ncbi:MAG: DUF3300 domain-containing protein [Candidatus Korobacteraceae bacterium]|jgi:uncharacterized membrane protein YgcG
MNLTFGERALSVVLCLALVAFTTPVEADAMFFQDQQQAAPVSAAPSDYSGQGAPLTAAELQGLVAPIALYPDALVAQILSAATFPDQVAVADNWLQQNKSLTGSALMNAVNGQSWDPSVKALTQFPSVLNQMAQSLAWTSQLGEAYHNQQAEVMAAVQTLRAQAKAAGNLKSGSQITVVQQSPQTIVIQPTNPQVVYVPAYNPTVIYGVPYTTPGYSTGALVATGLLSFGAGIAVGAMMSAGCCGWGWSSWNCDWHGGGVYYHGGAYYGNAAWHGGYYGNYNNYNNAYHNNYNNAYHNNYNNGYNSSGYHGNNYNNSGYNHTGSNNYNHTTNVSGNTVNVNNANRQNAGADHANSSASDRGWGGSDSGSGRGSTAFSGFGDHSSSGGGWGERSSSSRGWGSRGGGGGWGGGGRSFGGGGRSFGGGGRR